MLLKSGSIVNKRYLIVRQMAQGDTGAIYESIDRQSRQRVVLKQVEALHSNGHLPTEFAKDAQQLLDLRHVVLPEATNYFEDATGYFLVTEYVGGDDLWTMMQQREEQPFTLNEVLQWADQLLDVLTFLHTNSVPIVHGNIKPQNLKLTARGSIKLLDIGVARPQQQLFSANITSTFSFQYAAPEQLLGEKVDGASDIYALGATLYYLLTGRAFPNAIDRGIALALGQPDPLLMVEQNNPQMPTDIATVLIQAMAYLPEARFASAAAMRSALNEKQVLRTIVVAQEGEADYRSISTALQQAQVGERILVRPGVYHESLVLDRTVSIVGDGQPGQVVVESLNMSCLTIVGGQADISGLTLAARNSGVELHFFGVDVQGGEPTLENCTITCESLACVAIHGANTAPTIRNCQVHSSRQAGIDIYDRARGTLERCTIFNNTRAGIEISQNANPTVRQCTVRNGLASGIYIVDEGRGLIEDCDISANRRSGISIAQESNPLIRHCTIRYGADAGIFIYQHGHGTIENCQIIGNAAAGIEIKEGSDPIVRRCVVRDGQTNGIYVHSQGNGLIEQCDIFGNNEPGVALLRGGAPRLYACRIYDGKQAGLWISDGGDGIIEACELHSNQDANLMIAQDGNPLVRNCRIHSGHGFGIRVLVGAAGQVEYCTIENNARAGVAFEGRTTFSLLRCRITQNGNHAIHVLRGGTGLVQDCALLDNIGGAWYSEARHQVRSVGNVDRS